MVNLKNLFKNLRKKKPKVEGQKGEFAVPQSWIPSEGLPKSRDGSEFVIVEKEGKRKFRIPGLRLALRITTGFVLLFYFLLHMITLTGPPTTQPFALFFLLTSLLFVYFLWQTKKKKKVAI